MLIPKIISNKEYPELETKLLKDGYKYSMLTLNDSVGYWYKNIRYSKAKIKWPNAVTLKFFVDRIENTTLFSVCVDVSRTSAEKYSMHLFEYKQPSIDISYCEELALKFLIWVNKNIKNGED